MDKCTHEVRKQYWKNIISQCLQRPEGMTAKQWLDENNICEQTYYHWLKRIRQETYELANTSANTACVKTMHAIQSALKLSIFLNIRCSANPCLTYFTTFSTLPLDSGSAP